MGRVLSIRVVASDPLQIEYTLPCSKGLCWKSSPFMVVPNLRLRGGQSGHGNVGASRLHVMSEDDDQDSALVQSNEGGGKGLLNTGKYQEDFSRESSSR